MEEYWQRSEGARVGVGGGFGMKDEGHEPHRTGPCISLFEVRVISSTDPSPSLPPCPLNAPPPPPRPLNCVLKGRAEALGPTGHQAMHLPNNTMRPPQHNTQSPRNTLMLLAVVVVALQGPSPVLSLVPHSLPSPLHLLVNGGPEFHPPVYLLPCTRLPGARGDQFCCDPPPDWGLRPSALAVPFLAALGPPFPLVQSKAFHSVFSLVLNSLWFGGSDFR